MSDKPPKRAKAIEAKLSLSVEGIPRVLAGMRREVAQLLRDVADDEAPAVAARLREVADLFETGLSEEP